jgi:hypothetical protein
LNDGTDFYIQRMSWVLHPREAALGGLRFEIDENPSGQAAARDPNAWLVTGSDEKVRPAAPAHRTIAIRIRELVLHESPTRRGGAGIRLDALICTRTGYATWTKRWSADRDDQQPPVEHEWLFLGPVCDFLDLSLWLSPDTPGRDLAELLAQQAGSPAFEDAAAALRIDEKAGTPWVTAIGASTALARLAHDSLRADSGNTVGLYRTSFVAREGFGVGRHPARGLHRAGQVSFALVLESPDSTAA